MKPARHALVIGAGLAGCSTAAALTRHGWDVSVIAAGGPAASDVPAAVLAPPPLPGNDPVTEFRRRGASTTRALCNRLQHTVGKSGLLGSGVVLLPQRERDQRRFARLPEAGNGPIRLDARTASDWSGAELQTPCAYHPVGGWFDPTAFRDALLQYAGGPHVIHASACRLERVADQWVARARNGDELAAAPIAVVAAGMHSITLVSGLDGLLIPARGQATAVAADGAAGRLRLATSGGGYAVPSVQGTAWFGATLGRGDDALTARASDHERNLALHRRLWPQAALPAVRGEFVAIRATTRDRLPLAGPVDRDLWVSTGHGTQGLMSAPLAAALLARAITSGRIHPLLQRMDPGRFGRHENFRQSDRPT